MRICRGYSVLIHFDGAGSVISFSVGLLFAEIVGLFDKFGENRSALWFPKVQKLHDTYI